MAKEHHPLHALAEYLPPNTFEPVAHYIKQYNVHLTITRERKTILGNYRNAHRHQNHRITVNGNLNKYSFLITLLHELAHLLTYEKYAHQGTVAWQGVEEYFFGTISAIHIEKGFSWGY